MGLRKRTAALGAAAGVTAAALVIAGCSSGSSSSSPATGGASSSAASSASSSTSSSASSAPSTLTVWRMGGSVPAQVTWMNGVVAQFHKDFPQYAKTQVKVHI